MSAGMATTKPITVVMRAVQIPPASIVGSGETFSEIVRKTVTMPMTVPKRPSSGETAEISLSQVKALFTGLKCLWNK